MVAIVHGARDPLAKCLEGFNIPGVTLECDDIVGSAKKCIGGYVSKKNMNCMLSSPISDRHTYFPNSLPFTRN